VTKVTADHRTQNLVDIYLQINPDQVRTKEEMKELNAKYKRGEEVLPCTDFKGLTVRFAHMWNRRSRSRSRSRRKKKRRRRRRGKRKRGKKKKNKMREKRSMNDCRMTIERMLEKRKI
jgi:hypothetical protein